MLYYLNFYHNYKQLRNKLPNFWVKQAISVKRTLNYQEIVVAEARILVVGICNLAFLKKLVLIKKRLISQPL